MNIHQVIMSCYKKSPGELFFDADVYTPVMPIQKTGFHPK